ncbi:hypothetical protein L2E82_47189 [Cichorium intybus]|uniref:Uncharacterized protein n=1 Tax=Cichorium intybus TaxID=13427 RepID=A0ACB8YVI2_CICIN|nr:hypothetical protein L2E82_47189 [Cichorium intybus]
MEEPEEGEIHEEEDDVVVEESIEAAGNTVGGDGAVCQAPIDPSGRTDVLDSNDKGNNEVRESQRSRGNISPHKENNCMGNLEKTNGSLGNDSTPRVDPIPCNRDIHILPPDNRLGSSSFGPIGNLANSGCFGPFPSSKVMDQAELSSPDVGLNFSLGNSVGKRRRLLHPIVISPFDLSEHLNETQPIPPSFSPIDLNEDPIPSTVPLPDSDVDSPSSSAEIRKTAMVYSTGRSEFPKEKAEVQLIRDRIKTIEESAEVRPLTESEIAERMEGGKRLEEIFRLDSLDMKQRAKIRWEVSVHWFGGALEPHNQQLRDETEQTKKKIKRTVVLVKKNVLDVNDVCASILDRVYEIFGKCILIKLISADHCEPWNGSNGTIGKAAILEDWVGKVTPMAAGEACFS